MESKRGQVTIFIIIAIVILATVTLLFVFRDELFSPDSSLPADIEPVETSFLNCLEDTTKIGIDLLESQGGYIDLPDFEPGSAYSPFSSQLVFAGMPIPYWYYVSGNNIEKEQIPSKNEMEDQLGSFIEERIYACNLEEFYELGYVISIGEPDANVVVKEEEVIVRVDMDLSIQGTESNEVVRNHNIEVDTQLGKLYDSAKQIYDYEQDTLFLENYAVDTLRNYAPVDGVEFQCEPKVWNAEEVFDELEMAIEANTVALRGANNEFDLIKEENKYFVIDVPVEEQVRFINSRNWSRSFEVNPSDGAVMMAKPEGNQAGMGILGFCYVPYHFVYSVKYPVLVQVISGDLEDGEIFQFPLAVVVDKNMPREPYGGDMVSSGIQNFCEYKNTEMEIAVYDLESYPVEAEISYQCGSTICDIGETKNGVLLDEFPKCVNGYIIVKADGHEEAKQVVSTNQPGSYEVFLTPYYERDIELRIEGTEYNDEAIVSFLNLESGVSKTALYPDQTSVNLSGGQYEIQVYIYSDSEISIPESISEQCVEVPRSGVGGLFGLTEEECYDVTIPAQTLSNSLYAGGKQNYYILDEELKTSRKIGIDTKKLPVPKTIEELQANYLIFEDTGLEVVFR